MFFLKRDHGVISFMLDLLLDHQVISFNVTKIVKCSLSEENGNILWNKEKKEILVYLHVSKSSRSIPAEFFQNPVNFSEYERGGSWFFLFSCLSIFISFGFDCAFWRSMVGRDLLEFKWEPSLCFLKIRFG